MIKNRNKTILLFSTIALFLGISNGYGMENSQENLRPTVDDYESIDSDNFIEPSDYFSATEYYQLNVSENEYLILLMDDYHNNVLNLKHQSILLDTELYDLLKISLITLENNIINKYK